MSPVNKNCKLKHWLQYNDNNTYVQVPCSYIMYNILNIIYKHKYPKHL